MDQNSHTVKPLVSKLSTESVGIRRKLVANCVHTADADATQLDSCVASAVCRPIGYKIRIKNIKLLALLHNRLQLLFNEVVTLVQFT